MRKRSSYKPRPIIHPAMRSSADQSQAVALKLMGYQSLDLIMQGKGRQEEFDCLATVINLTTVLAEHGKGKEYISVCQAALDALRRMGERALKSGKYGLDGEGYQAIKDCLDLNRQQIDISTRLAISNAIMEVDRRVSKQGVAA